MRSPLQIWQFWRLFNGIGNLIGFKTRINHVKMYLLRQELILQSEVDHIDKIIWHLDELIYSWKINSESLKPKKVGEPSL